MTFFLGYKKICFYTCYRVISVVFIEFIFKLFSSYYFEKILCSLYSLFFYSGRVERRDSLEVKCYDTLEMFVLSKFYTLKTRKYTIRESYSCCFVDYKRDSIIFNSSYILVCSSSKFFIVFFKVYNDAMCCYCLSFEKFWCCVVSLV